ncbi:MAG: putative hydrolase, alpha/beta fold family [Cyanobacteria bacterium RYN_339]|nr:putative hydrolase, alpha/beta fold family [Cyanobacteria bacterium RYN_339]
MEERLIALPGVRLHAVVAGEGPLVVLLHGFPDHWRVWRHQIDMLVAAGFRVVAPDLRGYNLSDKPLGVEPYRLTALVDDVAALIGALGSQRAFVVGHDWGGVVAWHLAVRRPDRVERLAILNAPHPFLDWALLGPEQWLRSWHIGFFQLPWLPELALGAFDYALLRGLYAHASTRPGTITALDVEQSIAAISRPGALTAALNYYRAVPRNLSEGQAAVRVDLPVLVLWGERDPMLGPAMAAPGPGQAPQLALLRRPDAGHWIQLDLPGWVGDRLVAFGRQAKVEAT